MEFVDEVPTHASAFIHGFCAFPAIYLKPFGEGPEKVDIFKN